MCEQFIIKSHIKKLEKNMIIENWILILCTVAMLMLIIMWQINYLINLSYKTNELLEIQNKCIKDSLG